MSAKENPLSSGEKGTALDSVRRLEETLDDRRDAAERRRAALERTDEEARRILGEAKARAAELRGLAGRDRPAAAREVVGFVLPGGGG